MPDVGAVDRAERGEGLVPGGPLVRGGGAVQGRSGRRMVMAGQLAAGADRAGALLPVQPVSGARAPGPARSRPTAARVRRRARRSGPCARPSSRRSRRRTRGARGRRSAGSCADHGPGGSGTSGPSRSGCVRQHGGGCRGLRPGRVRRWRGEDLTSVQAGEFGGPQGPPQPFRLVARFRCGARRQAVREQVAGSAARGPGRFRRSRWRQGARWSASVRACCRVWAARAAGRRVEHGCQHVQRVRGSGRLGAGWAPAPAVFRS